MTGSAHGFLPRRAGSTFNAILLNSSAGPRSRQFSYDGAASATPHPDIVAAISRPDLRAIVICPSNPFISIEPILALPGMRKALEASTAPIVAVAPIIGGKAIKGPTAKMMRELGFEVGAETVAQRYGDLLDGYIVDHLDAALAAKLPIPTIATNAVDGFACGSRATGENCAILG